MLRRYACVLDIILRLIFDTFSHFELSRFSGILNLNKQCNNISHRNWSSNFEIVVFFFFFFLFFFFFFFVVFFFIILQYNIKSGALWRKIITEW